MDESTLKTTWIILAAVALICVFVYTSWRSRSKLQQIKTFPSVLQAAGLRIFTNPTLHESYRFLPEFCQNTGIEKTVYAASKKEAHTTVSALVYSERRGRATHPVLVLMATLSSSHPTTCIYTRQILFGPITPTNQHVFKTNQIELDQAFRITAHSEVDFRTLLTPSLQQFLLDNKDITHIEIAQRTVALFTADNHFFQLTTVNGIPSSEVLSRRLSQLRQLQSILELQFRQQPVHG
ncbi:hypothetical protein [Spirosoma harenae]